MNEKRLNEFTVNVLNQSGKKGNDEPLVIKKQKTSDNKPLKELFLTQKENFKFKLKVNFKAKPVVSILRQ